MANLLITLGDAESAVLAKAYLMGRPGYLDSVKELLEVAADVSEHVDASRPAAVKVARATLAQIADDVRETIQSCARYVRAN